MLKVLSTKTLPDTTASAAADMGMVLSCIDFITVHDIDFDVSALMSVIYDAMVFTSSNGVRSFFENENIDVAHWTKPVYAISQKTKQELAKHGLTPVATADNAEQLAKKIIADENIRSVLHICGNLTLDTLQTELMREGVSYISLVVYETVSRPVEVTESFDAIMFYSPSGVDSYVQKNKTDIEVLYCCVGGTTAEKLKSIDDQIDIILPKQPTPEGMLAAIRDFKKLSQDK